MLAPGIRIAVEDDGRDRSIDTMTAQLPGVVAWIDEQLRAGKRVVVHCLAGREQSATVVCAFLMTAVGMTLDEAVAYLKTKKPDVFFCGMRFRQSLSAFRKSG